jgi:hypothetical protein
MDPVAVVLGNDFNWIYPWIHPYLDCVACFQLLYKNQNYDGYMSRPLGLAA